MYLCHNIADASRKAKKDGKVVKGLETKEDGTNLTKANSNQRLSRSFTPMEIKKLIQDNIELLTEYYEEFGKDSKIERLYATLDEFERRANSIGNDRAITVEEFDDQFQTKELVYCVTKDNVNKRITLVFRGTTNSLAFRTNWGTNAKIMKKKAEIPEAFNKLEGISIHGGFYNYLFNETRDKEDEKGTTKYDQILADIKPLLAKYPDHKLYVTGHSLGGALCTLAAFYLAADPDIPKPVSCISFASPRVGDNNFFAAVQHLEKTKKLRLLRSVNDNDSVTALPIHGYHHVGFQVTQYAKPWWRFSAHDPCIYYPKPDLSFGEWIGMSIDNSFLASLNFGYDHSDYRERIAEGKEFLETKNLNEMYSDPEIVGYNLK